jgi:cbb3-type cytochrome oxidase subunit 3
MNPDVAAAVPRLVREGILTKSQALPLLRVAKGRLVSVYRELRLVLYAGVLLVTAGVGILVVKQLDRLGPLAIAIALSGSVAACFFWIHRKAPPFSWQQTTSADIAFDYILLLGVLLASADVAYIEAQFTPLGPNWPWHLLWSSLFMAWAAFRYDSRVVFSLALSSFASWRGVSVTPLEGDFWSNFGSSMRLNTLTCGLLFIGIGFVLLRTEKKEHFEPVATYLGWSLVLLSLISGTASFAESHGAYTAVLLLLGSVLALVSFLRRRFPLFAMGVVSVYFGLSRAVVSGLQSGHAIFWWFLVTSVLFIAGLVWARRTISRSS